MSLDSITDEALLKRGVENARSNKYNKRIKHPRWVAVMDLFVLGSGYSHELCRRFGLDPDELVARS